MSQKKLDSKGRWRNKTVGFRVSEQEWNEIDRYARLSGMDKQDYYRDRCQNKEIVVKVNPRIQKELKKEFLSLIYELQQIKKLSGIDDEIISRIEIILKIYGR